MMRRLTSAPKPSWRVRGVHREQVVVGAAQPVAHAVEAREVRRGLGRREHVVGAQPVGRRAAASTRSTVAPSSARELERRLEGARTRRARRPPRSARRARRGGRRPGARPWAARPPRACPMRRRVARVAAGHVAQQQRGVGHVARQRAGLVQRGGEGDHPVAAARAVGRLEADDARTARRAGGSSRRCPCPSAHGASPAATAAALPPLEPPGTRERSHGLRTGPKAEFSLDEPIANSSWLVLPSSGAPAAASRCTTVARVRRPVALEDPRAGLAGHALGAEEVLDRRAARRPAAPGPFGRRPPAGRRRPTGRR